MGTDWRDNDPEVEPMVEIYQGDRQNYEMPGAPKTNTDSDSIGGWRSLGFVSNALTKGYRLGFQASSDHVSTHMSYGNLWVNRWTVRLSGSAPCGHRAVASMEPTSTPRSFGSGSSWK
ncbi:hypothetical protein MYX75_00880 [Acidobacteria bacterium AH-259-A15]|nr:hypothetical protein [Acidobacteria bacterium AH-259-A15]